MPDLFDTTTAAPREDSAPRPLADRLRPRALTDVIGQDKVLAPEGPLGSMLASGALSSLILWGPPGVGKTTIARLLADVTELHFVQISAIFTGVPDLRKVFETAKHRRANGQGTLLFVDEIHRFNKAQQDFLLPYVEDGTITLIGATTENPSFEVISALLSRSRVYVLESLSEEEIRLIVERGAQALDVEVDQDAIEFLTAFANGDGRQALNLLETTANLYTTAEQRTITLDHVRDALQSKHLRYDKAEEEHYDTISAYIKSMRASDVDAALYYLARMVAGGEDPKFIARRMVIFASEDIGMAQPTALVVANEVFRAVETIGYPECQINLAHGTVYMALAPKDRSACDSFFVALEDVNRHGNLPIPLEIRNAPTRLMKDMGYGRGYDAYTEKSLLPEKLQGRSYYPKAAPRS